jgi:hypothetical protein
VATHLASLHQRITIVDNDVKLSISLNVSAVLGKKSSNIDNISHGSIRVNGLTITHPVTGHNRAALSGNSATRYQEQTDGRKYLDQFHL